MKILVAAASAAIALSAVPVLAQAQTLPTPTFYGTLGYSQDDLSHVSLGEIQGRIGARFGQYFGVEGEAGFGVDHDHRTFAGTATRLKLQNQEALYGVAFYPISPKIDLLARVGYGGETLKASTPLGTSRDSDNSWNYGAGAQYNLDGVNGVRADYTRKEFNGNNRSADVWAVAYTRRF